MIIFYKLLCIPISIILIRVSSSPAVLGNWAAVLLVPYLFPASHLTMGQLYQVKKINSYLILKIIIAIFSLFMLLFFVNRNISIWLVYSLGAWHVFSDEKFTLEGIQDFFIIEILFPVIIYGYHAYIKIFSKPLDPRVFSFFLIITAVYLVWIFSRRAFSVIGLYFLFLSLFNIIALYYTDYLALFEVLFFNTYYHTATWYIHYFTKTKGSFIYKRDLLVVNIILASIVITILYLPNRQEMAEFISKSFFFPGWILIHIILSLRPLNK